MPSYFIIEAAQAATQCKSELCRLPPLISVLLFFQQGLAHGVRRDLGHYTTSGVHHARFSLIAVLHRERGHKISKRPIQKGEALSGTTYNTVRDLWLLVESRAVEPGNVSVKHAVRLLAGEFLLSWLLCHPII